MDPDADADADGEAPVDADTAELVAAVHDHLRATAERPVETGASRWIGEAEAVVADVDGGDPPPEAVEQRLRQAADLLSNVEATGDPEADRHVEAARDLLAAFGTGE